MRNKLLWQRVKWNKWSPRSVERGDERRRVGGSSVATKANRLNVVRMLQALALNLSPLGLAWGLLRTERAERIPSRRLVRVGGTGWSPASSRVVVGDHVLR